MLFVFSLWSSCSYCLCVPFSWSVLLLLTFFLSNALLCTSLLLLKFPFFVFLSRFLLLEFLKFFKRSLCCFFHRNSFQWTCDFYYENFFSLHSCIFFLYPYYIFCGLHIQFSFLLGSFCFQSWNPLWQDYVENFLKLNVIMENYTLAMCRLREIQKHNRMVIVHEATKTETFAIVSIIARNDLEESNHQWLITGDQMKVIHRNESPKR